MLRELQIEIGKAILDNRLTVMVEHAPSCPTVVKYSVFVHPARDPQKDTP